MAVYKRGDVYWYSFVFKNKRYQESTHQGNKRVAEQMQAARKTGLAKGEVGLRDKVQAPVFRTFSERFMRHIETESAAKPKTVEFYRSKLGRLLEYQLLSAQTIDEIDEGLIDSYKAHRRHKVMPATVNRELATLRRSLRLAFKWKLVSSLPQFEFLPGERERTFVLSQGQEKIYLGAAPQPLNDLALFLLDTGLRISEALNLEWHDIHLDPITSAQFGYLRVEYGKSKNAKRNISLTSRVTVMLRERLAAARSRWVFENESGNGPCLPTSLNHQHQRVRKTLKLPKDFVIHGFRHTFLTRLGESGADAFTIMKIAGHSSVTVSQRYVHPSPETIERAFARLEKMNAILRKNGSPEGERQEPTTVSATVDKSIEPEGNPKLLQ